MGIKHIGIGIGIFLILVLSIVVFASVLNQRTEESGPEFNSKWVALGASGVMLAALLVLSSFAVTKQYFPERM